MEIPDRMKKFPLWHGYPIHFTVFVLDGVPDFKVVDQLNRLMGLIKNLCALCGESMKPPYAFIGGPKCMEHHGFIDGPMHPECATYAAKTCPYLSDAYHGDSKAAPKHAKNPEIITTKYTNTDAGRPVKMGLALTNTYKVVRIGKTEELRVLAGEWISVDWNIMPQRSD